MFIVGERINGTRKKIGKAIASRDTDHIKKEAVRQVEAGASCLDVNAGTVGDKEIEDMRWLVETVRGVVDVPLCVDSPNPKALRAGLEIAGEVPLVNSITGEKSRLEEIVPLVSEFNACVVCLLMDDDGMHSDPGERFSIASAVAKDLESRGIGNDRIYFDPCVKPVSTEPEQGPSGVEVVSIITRDIPEAHTICGLSNVSFGLPNRSALNATYLTLLMGAGLDSVIIDPLDPAVMTSLKAARTLLGKDEMCLEYIQAARAGKIQ